MVVQLYSPTSAISMRSHEPFPSWPPPLVEPRLLHHPRGYDDGRRAVDEPALPAGVLPGRRLLLAVLGRVPVLCAGGAGPLVEHLLECRAVGVRVVFERHSDGVHYGRIRLCRELVRLCIPLPVQKREYLGALVVDVVRCIPGVRYLYARPAHQDLFNFIDVICRRQVLPVLFFDDGLHHCLEGRPPVAVIPHQNAVKRRGVNRVVILQPVGHVLPPFLPVLVLFAALRAARLVGVV